MVGNINSEVTGSIWKVLCEKGQKIAEGDSLFILESMKMEIPVLADEDGTILDVLVAEGDSVTDGQTLARFET